MGDQNRVFGEETPTAGYGAAEAVRVVFVRRGRRHQHHHRASRQRDRTRLYRNHLNYLKDVLPEMGRNFKLVYSVSF